MPGALIGIGVLITLNFFMTLGSARDLRLERMLRATVHPDLHLPHRLQDDAARIGLKNDLAGGRARKRLLKPSQVDWAVLETSGSIAQARRLIVPAYRLTSVFKLFGLFEVPLDRGQRPALLGGPAYRNCAACS